MSENETTTANLLKLATELIEMRAKAAQGEWHRSGYHRTSLEIDLGGNGVIYDEGGHNEPDADFICLAANNACDIITGYQDLVREMIGVMEIMESYYDGYSDMDTVFDAIFAKARAAIPNSAPEFP